MPSSRAGTYMVDGVPSTVTIQDMDSVSTTATGSTGDHFGAGGGFGLETPTTLSTTHGFPPVSPGTTTPSTAAPGLENDIQRFLSATNNVHAAAYETPMLTFEPSPYSAGDLPPVSSMLRGSMFMDDGRSRGDSDLFAGGAPITINGGDLASAARGLHMSSSDAYGAARAAAAVAGGFGGGGNTAGAGAAAAMDSVATSDTSRPTAEDVDRATAKARSRMRRASERLADDMDANATGGGVGGGGGSNGNNGAGGDGAGSPMPGVGASDSAEVKWHHIQFIRDETYAFAQTVQNVIASLERTVASGALSSAVLSALRSRGGVAGGVGSGGGGSGAGAGGGGVGSGEHPGSSGNNSGSGGGGGDGAPFGPHAAAVAHLSERLSEEALRSLPVIDLTNVGFRACFAWYRSLGFEAQLVRKSPRLNFFLTILPLRAEPDNERPGVERLWPGAWRQRDRCRSPPAGHCGGRLRRVGGEAPKW